MRENGLNHEQDREQDAAPEFVYHGSLTPDIEKLEPRKRSTPGGVDHEAQPDLVYAGDHPAFAAAHAFPWDTREGFELSVEGDKVLFRVPEQLRDRLKVPVHIYKLSGEGFGPTAGEGTGHTFHVDHEVAPESVESFDDVQTAIENFGGVVEYYKREE
ncbi:hypothetical protein KKI23_01670 [Patescibacteria group bacterium]|nr:hypothetical protein [Patescibacteria group bacterium]